MKEGHSQKEKENNSSHTTAFFDTKNPSGDIYRRHGAVMRSG